MPQVACVGRPAWPGLQKSPNKETPVSPAVSPPHEGRANISGLPGFWQVKPLGLISGGVRVGTHLGQGCFSLPRARPP